MLGLRNLIAFAAGVVLIAVGFYTLARGSLTLAPILLVAGYCVAIPVGIMISGGRAVGSTRGASDERANSSAG